MSNLPYRLLWSAGIITALLSSSIRAQDAPETRSATARALVTELVPHANVAAGIEVGVGCRELPTLTFQVFPGDLDKSLDSMAKQDGTVTWKKNNGLYTVVIKATHSPSIASIQVPQKQIRARTLDGAVDALLTDPLVKAELSRINSHAGPDRLGFASVNEREEKLINISAGSLDGALNTMAKSFGTAVWEIYERDCNGDRSFQITWVTK